MNNEVIGAFIAKCRKELNMTQEDLAVRLGVTQKSISRWERGRTMPDLSLYEPLCEALGLKVSELLYGKKMTDEEKRERGDASALNLLATKSKLETFAIYTEILILVGIVIAITLTGTIADTTLEKIITLASGCFVWGFGLILRVKIRKAIQN